MDVRLLLVLAGALTFAAATRLQANPGFGQNCVKCHEEITPGIVSDWRLSTHSQYEVGCSECHGTNVHCASCHGGGEDVTLPSPDTCASCHEDKVRQFREGKHARAWAAMKAMPAAHAQPVALLEGMKGCGACHKIGLKTEDEVSALKASGAGYAIASCDACHTRHLFSVLEARQPQACQTCHMGFDHPQWETYSSSKHGVRYLLKQNRMLPESVAAPTCQTCHMPEGHHAVRTGWGFLAARLPMPEDPQWAADRTTILKALGVLGPDGNPTARLELIKEAEVVRLTQQEWQKERDQMLQVCSQCHAANFAQAELEKGDEIIRRTDRLLAEAIGIVAGLYEDGILNKPQGHEYAFPDLLSFLDAPAAIEERLFEMHLRHRRRAFQGTFHSSPDYALRYGWSAMQTSLAEIKELAQKMREKVGR